MAASNSTTTRDFETLPFIDRIISHKWILPLSEKILGHKTLGPVIKKILDRTIMTYLICGVLTTIVGIASFWFCQLCITLLMLGVMPSEAAVIEEFKPKLGFIAAASNIISSAVAIVFAFIVNKHFVFLSKDWSLRKTAKEFWQFTGGRLIVMAGETGLLYLLVDKWGFNTFICKLFTMVLIVIVNYFISKLIF